MHKSLADGKEQMALRAELSTALNCLITLLRRARNSASQARERLTFGLHNVLPVLRLCALAKRQHPGLRPASESGPALSSQPTAVELGRTPARRLLRFGAFSRLRHVLRSVVELMVYCVQCLRPLYLQKVDFVYFF